MKKLLFIGALFGITSFTSAFAIDCDLHVSRFMAKGANHFSELNEADQNKLMKCIKRRKGEANTPRLKKFYPEVFKDPTLNLGKNSKYYDKKKYDVIEFNQSAIQDEFEGYDVAAIMMNYNSKEDDVLFENRDGHVVITSPDALCSTLMPGSKYMEAFINGKKTTVDGSNSTFQYISSEKSWTGSLKVKEPKILNRSKNIYYYEFISCAKAKKSKYKIKESQIDQIFKLNLVIEADNEDDNEEDPRVNNNSRNSEDEEEDNYDGLEDDFFGLGATSK